MVSERSAERAAVGRGGIGWYRGRHGVFAPSGRLAECVVGSDLAGSLRKQPSVVRWGAGLSDKLTSIF